MTVSLDYYHGGRIGEMPGQFRSLGAALVQAFDRHRSEAFLAIRRYAFAAPDGHDYRDITSVLAGFRYRF